MLQAFRDYVFVEKVHMITDDGVFLGTQKHLFCAPTKSVATTYSKMTTTFYTLRGTYVHEVIQEIIEQSKSTSQLEEEMLALKNEMPEIIHYNLEEVGAFKVQAGFLGSGIHVNPTTGKFGYKPFVQRLGKSKKEIKEFYLNHPKLG